MAGLYFIFANIILLGVNIIGLVSNTPAIGFASAILLATAGITGKLTNNTNIFLFWLSIGLSVLYAAFAVITFI